MNEDIVVPIAFFGTVTVLGIGIPLVRAYVRRLDRGDAQPRIPSEVGARLERIEHAVDAMAVEVERISEGQRFVTKILAEREPAPDRLAAGRAGASGSGDDAS